MFTSSYSFTLQENKTPTFLTPVSPQSLQPKKTKSIDTVF